MVQNTLTDVSGLRGLWHRALIAWPDGSRDTTTGVHWLQGLRAFIDLRQPAGTADFSRVRARSDLSMHQCAWLATQQGFAGHLSFDGSHFEWIRTIDYQPRAPSADAGSLCWQGDVLVETGRDSAYIEHWQRDAAAPTLPVGAVTLRAIDEQITALLLRVGAQFMFARDRAVVPAAHRTLGECVAAASSLRRAQELVDCEISFGEVRASGFYITASSLPYRVGDALSPKLTGEHLTTTDRAADGTAVRRRWRVTGSEGEPDAVQQAGAPSP